MVNLIFYTLSMLVKNENKKCSDYKVGEEVTLQPLSPVKIVFAQKKLKNVMAMVLGGGLVGV